MDGLPDELIINIVSLLPVKEAAKTSVLARRWRHFWAYKRVMKFRIDFDQDFEDSLEPPLRRMRRYEKIFELWTVCRFLPMMKELVLQFNVKVLPEDGIRLAILAIIRKASLMRHMRLMLVGAPFYKPRRAVDLREASDCSGLQINGHECLKVLEIVGGGTALAVEVALCVMECVATLNMVVIDGMPYEGEDLRLLKVDFRAKVAAAVEC